MKHKVIYAKNRLRSKADYHKASQTEEKKCEIN